MLFWLLVAGCVDFFEGEKKGARTIARPRPAAADIPPRRTLLPPFRSLLQEANAPPLPAQHLAKHNPGRLLHTRFSSLRFFLPIRNPHRARRREREAAKDKNSPCHLSNTPAPPTNAPLRSSLRRPPPFVPGAARPYIVTRAHSPHFFSSPRCCSFPSPSFPLQTPSPPTKHVNVGGA